jgi:hypothetical protein
LAINITVIYSHVKSATDAALLYTEIGIRPFAANTHLLAAATVKSRFPTD